MPSRVIRSDFVSSRSMLRVSIPARHTFALLILTVDDFGRFDGRLQILLSTLYPGGDVKPKQLAEWLAELEAEGCVRFYTVGDAQFLYLTAWETHRGKSRRADVSRYPDPRDAIQAIPGNPGDSVQSEDFPSGVGGGVGDGDGETTRLRAPRTTTFPDVIDEADRVELRTWALDRGVDDEFLAAQVEACRDWALSKGARKADWIATLRGWVRRAWVESGQELLDPKWRDDLGRSRSEVQAARDALREARRSQEMQH